MNALDRISAILARLTGVPADKIGPDDYIADDLGLTLVQQACFVRELDLPEVPENCRTVADFARLVN